MLNMGTDDDLLAHMIKQSITNPQSPTQVAQHSQPELAIPTIKRGRHVSRDPLDELQDRQMEWAL